MVEQFVPEKHKGLMIHIRKTILKQKRLQKLNSEESDNVKTTKSMVYLQRALSNTVNCSFIHNTQDDDQEFAVRKMKAYKPRYMC